MLLRNQLKEERKRTKAIIRRQTIVISTRGNTRIYPSGNIVSLSKKKKREARKKPNLSAQPANLGMKKSTDTSAVQSSSLVPAKKDNQVM